jgi:hypothetical protein
VSPRKVGETTERELVLSSSVSPQQGEQNVIDILGAEEVTQVGTVWVTEKERYRLIAEVSRVATQVADMGKMKRRYWVVLCGACGDVFIRSSGVKGYDGKSTWAGKCSLGHKAHEQDEMVGEAIPTEEQKVGHANV